MFAVSIHSNVPLDLLDVKDNAAICSRSMPEPQNGTFALAGLALFTHVVILQSKHVQLMTASMFHVTNLAPPGSERQPFALATYRLQESTNRVGHCTS